MLFVLDSIVRPNLRSVGSATSIMRRDPTLCVFFLLILILFLLLFLIYFSFKIHIDFISYPKNPKIISNYFSSSDSYFSSSDFDFSSFYFIDFLFFMEFFFSPFF